MIPAEKTLGIVVGYVPDVDVIDAEARRLAMWNRCAFILDTGTGPELDFDEMPYGIVLQTVWNVVKADRLRVTSAEQGPQAVGSVDEALARLMPVDASERQPFLKVLYYEKERVKALVSSEPYALMGGGPRVYHDQYVVPVYSAEDIAEALVEESRRLGAARAVRVEKVLVGLPRPHFSRRATISRLLRRVFGG